MRYIYCPRRNTFFAHIEKSGCESLRYLVLKEENVRDLNIWKMNMYLTSRIPSINSNYMVIVRNPYNRLVSGYLDKICSDNYKHLGICKAMHRYYNTDYEKRITFEQFVNYIVRQHPGNIDAHFQPQSYMFHKTQNMKIFKIEESKDIENELIRIGFVNKYKNYNTVVLPNCNKERFDMGYVHNKYFHELNIENKVPIYSNFFTPELIELVYNYYQCDFKNFHYDRNIN